MTLKVDDQVFVLGYGSEEFTVLRIIKPDESHDTHLVLIGDRRDDSGELHTFTVDSHTDSICPVTDETRALVGRLSDLHEQVQAIRKRLYALCLESEIPE